MICSGGYVVFFGVVNIEGGVIVDFWELNFVIISEDCFIVVIGLGVVWSEVYLLLVFYNLIVMGGRVVGVGVGGFLIGGVY